jgi:TetR/AcrR family transcriptional regulator, transcriptional repressor for nem operon
MATTQTKDCLLDLAQEYMQTVGYNAFSYHDLADRIGIKTASIHYHFPTKADLASAVVERYRQRFREALGSIENSSKADDKKLAAFADLFLKTLEVENRVCLCGMLASDLHTLPEEVRGQVREFFVDLETWLATLLARLKKCGAIKLAASPQHTAVAIVGLLEGAMLTARAFEDPTRFRASARWMLGSLGLLER